MSDTSFLKRRWKLLLNIVTLIALVGLIIAMRHQLAATVADLGKVNAWVLLLILPIEAINYHAQTRQYQHLFKMVDEKVPYRGMLRAALELNFVNHVFPSGGVSGISYFSYKMHEFGIRGTKSTLVQTIKLLTLFVSFEILLFFGMFFLAINGEAGELTILMGTALSVVVIFGTGILLYIIGSRSRINTFLTTLTVLANWIIRLFRRKHPETINIAKARRVFVEFHHDYVTLKSHYRELNAPFWWAFVANVMEVMVVYTVYMAFGQFVNIGAVILGYAVANFAGLISVLPGGVGIYEALMTATLAAAGIPPSLSLPVTVMYRVLSTLVQVPIGYLFYHNTLQRKHPKPTLTPEHGAGSSAT